MCKISYSADVVQANISKVLWIRAGPDSESNNARHRASSAVPQVRSHAPSDAVAIRCVSVPDGCRRQFPASSRR